MKEITLPVTIHPNIHLLLPLVQPEPADTDSRPETQHCHGCGGGNMSGSSLFPTPVEYPKMVEVFQGVMI